MTVRKLDQPRGWAYTLGVVVLKPPLLTFTKRTWIDGDKIPATGGCVVVVNHISHADPLTTAHFLYDHGRLPRYLAKSNLFENAFLKRFLTSAGQIPVKRLTTDALGAYSAAVEAVRAGECVVVYPEGTITREPDLWPMRGKTGAARIALETACPVIPVAQWGVQHLLAPYAKKPDLLPRKRGDLPRRRPRRCSTTCGSCRSSAEVTQRGHRPDHGRDHRPCWRRSAARRHRPTRYDPRARGITEIGNPNKKKKGRRP